MKEGVIMDPNETNEQQKKDILSFIKAGKMKKRIITAAIIFVSLLIVILIAWLSGGKQARKNADSEIAELKAQLQEQDARIQQLIEMPIVVSPASPKIDLDIIYSQINDIGELATIEYLFTDAAEFRDSKQIKGWNIPFTEKSFILKWDGVIKAGVKLDQVSIQINESDKKIIVALPPAEILSYSVNSDSVELLNEKDNIFNNISVSDKVGFDAKTEEAMKKRAIENGLLEKALENAKDILQRLIQADPAVNSEYVIEFVVD